MDPGLPRLAACFLLSALLALPAAAEPAEPPSLPAVLTHAKAEWSPHPLLRWQAALREIDRDRLRVQRCLAARPCRDIMAKPMAELVRRYSGLSGTALITAVNRHYNTFPYVVDQAGGRPEDDWGSPLVFLQRSGDCEDFAIAKYLTLRLLGVPETAMAILVLRHPARRADHAVLLVEDQGRILVLDNLLGLESWEVYRDYQPLFALTADSSWRARSRFAQARGLSPVASR